MFTVIYNADPNAALGNEHTAKLHKCIEVRESSFQTNSEAISFLLECSSPITKLDELMTKEEFPIAEGRFLTLGDVILNDDINYLDEN